jgi:hypothetical protein
MMTRIADSDTVTNSMRIIDEFLQQKPKGPLYHYTSAEGLLGMMQTRTIWATSVQHLNDAQEYQYGVELLREELTTRLRAERGPANERYGELLKSLEGRQPGPIYVTCFSEKGDLLSQWRAYCPKGNGYSISLDGQHLQHVEAAHGFRLLKCVYDLEEQRDLCRALIDAFINQENVDLPDTTAADFWETMERSFQADQARRSKWAEKLLMVAAALKHQGFKEEQEWRFVGLGSSASAHCFREGRFGIVPFCKIPLCREDQGIKVNEIIIGPTGDRSAALMAVGTMLWFYADDYDPSRVPPIYRATETPYRP